MFARFFRTIAMAGILALANFGVAQPTRAQSQDKFYYWVAPRFGIPITLEESRVSPPLPILRQGFVVEVNATIKARIDNLMAKGHDVGVRGHIAAGAVDYSRNYYAPDHPVWNWHFVSVNSLRDFTLDPYDPREGDPNRDAFPSTIDADPQQWIANYGDAYYPKAFSIFRQIDPSKSDALANVSNRGLAGTGERTLVTGFIITGGQPRTVVVRALGPSLAAAGVQEPAMNPKLDLFRGSYNIISNTDWKASAGSDALAELYPALAPTDDREAALLLTLIAGAYTVKGSTEDGSEGIELLEVYDVNFATQP